MIGRRVRARDAVLAPGAPFPLELGGALEQVRVAYRTWGRLAPDGANAVVVCHALTGSADAAEWWSPLFGAGRALDPARDFVVCANVLGSCLGTTGPASPRPGGGVYGPDFPPITVRDVVRLQALLLAALGVTRVRLVLGGSLGGMQALEWALLYPELVDAVAAVAAPARQSSYALALDEVQRQTIAADPRWRGGRYAPDDPPRAGLGAARALAVCSYRGRAEFEGRFGLRRAASGEHEVGRYLRVHGERLARRFDANAYVALTRVCDAHDVGRGRGGVAAALAALRAKALVVAVDSDLLYPPEELRALAAAIPGARFALLSSPRGHDAFLADAAALDPLLVSFRAAVEDAAPAAFAAGGSR